MSTIQFHHVPLDVRLPLHQLFPQKVGLEGVMRDLRAGDQPLLPQLEVALEGLQRLPFRRPQLLPLGAEVVLEGSDPDEARPPLAVRRVLLVQLRHVLRETVVVLVILKELNLHGFHGRREEEALLSTSLCALLGGKFIDELKESGDG